MRRIGLQNVRLIETPGNPVVYGDWLGAPGAPTILFYGHYDVQPVDPLELWQSPPFEATVRDGEIYARGAADDKGQVFMHLKAVEAHMKQNGRLPVNIKFIIEGEEEVGSANLDEFVRAHKDELKADVVVISDSAMFARGVPSICYGLRGLVYFQIDLRGSNTDLHSGVIRRRGRQPGVRARADARADEGPRRPHQDSRASTTMCVPLQEEERQAWAPLPFNEKQYRKDFGIPKVFGETGYTTLERTWARPTFEVNGLLSGFTGEGAKTVLPAVAMAKVSMRLVPNQDPDKIARAVRGVRREARAEDRRAEGHADARRQAVDDVVRQPVHPGRGPRHRARLRPSAGVHARRRIDSGRVDLPGGAGAAVGAVRRRAAGRERARAEREARRRQLPQRHHLVRDSVRGDREALSVVSSEQARRG